MDLDHFSFLLPGELAGVAYPPDTEALDQLVERGIRSLVAVGDPPPATAPAGLQVFHHRVPDFCRVPVEVLQEAVQALVEAPRPAAVCCGSGIGRTGVVLACYLVSLGRSAYQALAEVRAARPGSVDDDSLELAVHDYFEFVAHGRRAVGEALAVDAALADDQGHKSHGGEERPVRRAVDVASVRSHPAAGLAPLFDHSNPASSVFLMMRFRDEEPYRVIERAISSTLGEYSLEPRRADWQQHDELLWSNVCKYMEGCGMGVAVFDQLLGDEVSPNVCLELGYMLAHHRPCLLLKERSMAPLQADLAGHLYKEFDAGALEQSVAAAVRAWLQEQGIAKKRGERLLVYVSTGGTCRDPMAKVITRELLGPRLGQLPLRMEALAKGEPSGPGASVGARTAIQDLYGLDLLAEHRTARLTATMIKEADLILVMERSLLKGLPPDKAFALTDFVGLEGQVEDPWSLDHDDRALLRYRRCAGRLVEVLEHGLPIIMERLFPGGSV